MGDTKYAPLPKFEQTRLCLHSSRLRVRFGDRDLDLVAPLPQEMRDIGQILVERSPSRRTLKILRSVVTPMRGSPISALGSEVSILSKSAIPNDSA